MAPQKGPWSWGSRADRAVLYHPLPHWQLPYTVNDGHKLELFVEQLCLSVWIKEGTSWLLDIVVLVCLFLREQIKQSELIYCISWENLQVTLERMGKTKKWLKGRNGQLKNSARRKMKTVTVSAKKIYYLETQWIMNSGASSRSFQMLFLSVLFKGQFYTFVFIFKGWIQWSQRCFLWFPNLVKIQEQCLRQL